jgi:hypothetical protein
MPPGFSGPRSLAWGPLGILAPQFNRPNKRRCLTKAPHETTIEKNDGGGVRR